MAIFYRAMWTDTVADVTAYGSEEFLAWVRHKTGGELGEIGVNKATSDESMRLRFALEHGEDDAMSVLRASFVETNPDGSRWTTTLRAWEAPVHADELEQRESWLWVDVDAVTHESFDRLTIGAPVFVRRLIANGSNPHRSGTPLSAFPQSYPGEIGAEELCQLLTDPERDLPVVVFAPLADEFQFDGIPPGVTLSEYFDQVIRRAAEMTAGMALVCTVDIAAVRTMGDILGRSYEVRDGAYRIYLPRLDPAMDESWRHRYTVPVRFLHRRDAAGRMINRAISLQAGTRRAPDSYDVAAQRLETGGRAPAEFEELLEIADAELAEQRTRLAAIDQSYLDVIDELQTLEEENNGLRADLDVARKKIALAGSRLWLEQGEALARVDSERLPDGAASPSVAKQQAQQRLDKYLSLPDKACVDLDDLDNAVQSRAWGETSWRAFVALYYYGEALAEGDEPGTFWTWCATSRHSFAWPATPKKLSMSESASVKRSDKFRAKRTFPIDTAIDPAGEIYMEAHIKIAEGGGMLAPRIYFHASRKNARVYVGYFGPHRNVPNKSG